MELFIELPSKELLDEFRQFAFDQDNDFEFSDQHDYTPGFNKEPVVVAIIVALGGPVVMYQLTKIIKAFLGHYQVKHKDSLQANIEKDKLEKELLEKLFTLKIKNADKLKQIKSSDFVNCSIAELKALIKE